MTVAVRRSGFTIPLSLVALTSTAMLLAGCQSGGASNANQQGTAVSTSSAKAQSTPSAKPTSGQKSAQASPRIPSPTGKGTGESSTPQASSNAHPSSPRADEPRPVASGTQSSGSGAGAANRSASPGASSSSKADAGSSSAPQAGSPASQDSQSEPSQPAQSPAAEAPTSSEPAQTAEDAGNATPAPSSTEAAAPEASQATSYVSDNLVTEKTAMVVSPSGNIGCDLSAHFAGCGVLSYRSEATFGQDEQGSPNWWFDLGSGEQPQISSRGEGSFSLDESFRGAGSSPQVIEYGQSVTFGSWVCSSEESGMTCRNTETGHGVFLSSSRYETF